MKKTCDKCNASIINGLFCHERGCQNERKQWFDGDWINMVTCRICGYDHPADTQCDCDREN